MPPPCPPSSFFPPSFPCLLKNGSRCAWYGAMAPPAWPDFPQTKHIGSSGQASAFKVWDWTKPRISRSLDVTPWPSLAALSNPALPALQPARVRDRKPGEFGNLQSCGVFLLIGSGVRSERGNLLSLCLLPRQTSLLSLVRTQLAECGFILEWCLFRRLGICLVRKNSLLDFFAVVMSETGSFYLLFSVAFPGWL